MFISGGGPTHRKVLPGLQAVVSITQHRVSSPFRHRCLALSGVDRGGIRSESLPMWRRSSRGCCLVKTAPAIAITWSIAPKATSPPR